MDDVYDNFLVQNNYTLEEREQVAALTVGQSDNEHWHGLRQDRMTASNGHRVFTRMNTLLADPTADPAALLKTLTTWTDISHLSNVRWGIEREKKAILEYEQMERQVHDRLAVSKHGFEISPTNPFVGCSPDGVVTCKCKSHTSLLGNKWLIEVKCPGSYKDKSPQEAAIAQCGVLLENKSWTLKPNHKYYTQIQMQLGIMGLAHCELIVYTKQGHLKVVVPYNEQKFQEILSNLSMFGKTYLFPHLVSCMFV